MKTLLDTGAQISVTGLKLPVLSDAAICTIVGFNGTGDSQAKMCKNVSFEIPGHLKTEIDMWFCKGSENIIGADILYQKGWIIDLGNGVLWKGSANRKPVVIDPADYSEVGSICLTETVDNDYKWPDTGDNLKLKQVVQSHKKTSESEKELGWFI